MQQRKATMHSAFWLRLDNAAKIYPAIRSSELTAVFRISVVLKERVKAKEFREAVADIEDRFPYYKVRLRPGFFWYYLEHHNVPMTVAGDTDALCRPFGKKELMFRILVKENRISVEFSHVLTDGAGAYEFLRTLLLVYFSHCGVQLPPDLHFLRPEEKPAEEEYEDAYKRYFRKTVSPPIQLRAAFHLPFALNNRPRLRVLTIKMPVAAILKKAKAYGVSLTEYLVSVYLFALQEIFEKLPPLKRRISNKILRIEVPANLRKIYPTASMRNFSLYVLPEIDLRLGHYTFEEIVKTVYHLMRLETDEKLILKMLSRNVEGERNPLVRPIPLFIKSFLFSILYSLGTSRYSGVVTNLGKLEFPSEINSLIDGFLMIPPPPAKKLKVNCAVVGFNEKLVLGFANITLSDAVEQQFMEFLKREGIAAEVEEY